MRSFLITETLRAKSRSFWAHFLKISTLLTVPLLLWEAAPKAWSTWAQWCLTKGFHLALWKGLKAPRESDERSCHLILGQVLIWNWFGDRMGEYLSPAAVERVLTYDYYYITLLKYYSLANVHGVLLKAAQSTSYFWNRWSLMQYQQQAFNQRSFCFSKSSV